MRLMAARGEIRVRLFFGPTSSPLLAHAVSYAIEHAWQTEQLRSGSCRHHHLTGLNRPIHLDPAGLPPRDHTDEMTKLSEVPLVAFDPKGRLPCSAVPGSGSGSRGRCGAQFPSARGAPRCRVCPLYDPGYAGEFWVQPRPVLLLGSSEEVPDCVPEEWTGG
jgi:hypothetical protein